MFLIEMYMFIFLPVILISNWDLTVYMFLENGKKIQKNIKSKKYLTLKTVSFFGLIIVCYTLSWKKTCYKCQPMFILICFLID